MAKWTDTRPERPAGSYFVGGVEFKGGTAETGALTAGGRALFKALGIVPADEAPADAPEVVESGLPEGAVVLDDADPEIAERVEAAEPEPPKRSTRSRSAK